MLPFVDSIFVGQPKRVEDGRGTWVSSIYRERVNGSIEFFDHGLAGDRVPSRITAVRAPQFAFTSVSITAFGTGSMG